MAVESVSNSRRALVEDDSRVAEKRVQNNNDDNRSSDKRAVRKQDDAKGNNVDAEA